jgi:recombinational DNA repair ATPase RecF
MIKMNPSERSHMLSGNYKLLDAIITETNQEINVLQKEYNKMLKHKNKEIKKLQKRISELLATIRSYRRISDMLVTTSSCRQ